MTLARSPPNNRPHPGNRPEEKGPCFLNQRASDTCPIEALSVQGRWKPPRVRPCKSFERLSIFRTLQLSPQPAPLGRDHPGPCRRGPRRGDRAQRAVVRGLGGATRQSVSFQSYVQLLSRTCLPSNNFRRRCRLRRQHRAESVRHEQGEQAEHGQVGGVER